jgi:hypothetical protein
MFETDFANGRAHVLEAVQDLAKKNKVAGKQPKAKTLEEVMATPALV